jgi:hypothetical protein
MKVKLQFLNAPSDSNTFSVVCNLNRISIVMSNQATIIKLLTDASLLIPEVSRTNRQYGFYAEYLQHYEFELALDSLIELVDETSLQVPTSFWEYLYQAAEAMRLEQHCTFLLEKTHSNAG